MPLNLFSTGVSGLLGFQTALSTVGHNISNAATEGYSRQRVDFASRPGDHVGNIFIGNGVEVSAIRRVYDQFITGQLFSNTASMNRYQTFYNLSSEVDNMLGDPTTSISTGMQDFFESVNAVATDPASRPARDAMIDQAQAIVDRFSNINARLDSLEGEVNSRLESAVSDVNSLSSAIASLNEQIAHTSASGASPNDLLDQRDELVRQLNEQIQVSTVTQDDGSINVFIGNGQAIVHGFQSEDLTLVHDDHQSVRLDLAYAGSGTSTVAITGGLGGGVIGGALDFRNEVLDPTRNEIGKVALAFVQSFNAQHRAGMDLNGNMGGDFFTVGGPLARPDSGNTGSAGMNVTVSDIGALTGQDYMFTFDGANWTAHDPATNTPVSFTGTGTAADPFVIDGVSIEVTGVPAAGDSILVQPTANAVAGMQVLITDPASIAAAAPIRTEAALANTGSASIDAGTVLDPTDPNLLSTVTISFVDANNYSVNGGPPLAYTSGAPIDVNGWRVQISGTPDAGDTFTVEANSGGTGDNRNALALAGIQAQKLLDGATQTLESSYGSLVSDVGGQTQNASLNADAQSLMLQQSEAARASVSGVNLDEEAANLLRFQQAYSAAAQVVKTADEVFQILLGAIGR
jgi:flagellar hook-associated protein 1 FlgK